VGDLLIKGPSVGLTRQWTRQFLGVPKRKKRPEGHYSIVIV